MSSPQKRIHYKVIKAKVTWNINAVSNSRIFPLRPVWKILIRIMFKILSLVEGPIHYFSFSILGVVEIADNFKINYGSRTNFFDVTLAKHEITYVFFLQKSTYHSGTNYCTKKAKPWTSVLSHKFHNKKNVLRSDRLFGNYDGLDKQTNTNLFLFIERK